MMGSHEHREAKAQNSKPATSVQLQEEEGGDAVQAQEADGGDDVQAQEEEGGGEGPVQAKVAPLMSHWAEGAGPVVQKDGDEDVQQKATAKTSSDVHAAAKAGTAGSGSSLPHLDKIQQSFGKHDVSGIQHYSGGAAEAASKSMGAEAFAVGNKVASKGGMNLHTAAHEAAHVVQQRAGAVQLQGGVGKAGDQYEKHADAVADRVVQGKPAGDLLDQMAGGKGGASVQKSEGEGDVQMIGERLDKDLSPGSEAPAHGEDKGQQRRYSVEQYEAMWEKEQGRKLTPEEKSTIARGCIGITANNLQGGGNPPLNNAYASFDQAHTEMGKMNQKLEMERANPSTAAQAQGKHAVLFAKMFWSNQNPDQEKRKKADPNAFKPGQDGKVDMSKYRYHGQPGYVNFDYAFWDETSYSFWHANHCQPGMKVYQSTKEKFAKGYIDFDRVIYCVAVAENYDPGLAAAVHVGSAGGGQPPAGAGAEHD
jgi:hypothetical protein